MYVLKWAEEYDRQLEEDALKADGSTGRLGGQDPPRSHSARGTQRSSPAQDLPQRAQTAAPRRQLPGDFRLREADTVAEDARWTTTTIGGKSETWISAPGAFQEQAWAGWRSSQSGGSGGASGSAGNSSSGPRGGHSRGHSSQEEPSGKKRPLSKNKIDKTRIETIPEAPAATPSTSENLGDQASAKAATALQFQHIVELADSLENRLLQKVADEGESAPFTTSTATLLALVSSLTTSRNCGQAVVSERESATILEKLQQIDRENPTPASASSKSKAKAKARPSYSEAAAHVPPQPAERTPEPGALFSIYQGRRVWRNPVFAILDYKGVLADNDGILEGVTDDVRHLLRQNTVIDVVSWIGVKDRYSYYADKPWADSTRTANFFRTVERWVARSNFPRAPAPGMGYIRYIKVVDDRTGPAHSSKALREHPYKIDNHWTTGGKDQHAYWKGCAAIIDDHAGTCQACAEAGLVYYLVSAGRANHDRRGARVFDTPRHAFRAFSEDLEDPVRRYDFEQRAKEILKPCSQIRYRTDCPDAADKYYDKANFLVWNIQELVRWKDRGGLAYEREQMRRQ